MHRIVQSFLIILCSLLFSQLTVQAQDLGTWQSYSSLRPVTFIDEDASGRIWVMTEGGLYSVVNGQIDAIYTRTEGLYGLNASAMSYHEGTNTLWIGFEDGMIQRFDPTTELFEQEASIFRATQFSRRIINTILTTSDKIYIGTGFGVVVYDPQRNIVLETYSNLGTFPSAINVNALFIQGSTVYAGTDVGVAIGNSSTGDLVNPASWTTTSHIDGTSRIVRSLAFFRNTLYAGIGSTNYRYNGTSWQPASELPSEYVRRFRISRSGNRLIAISDTYIRIIENTGSLGSINLPSATFARDFYLDDRSAEQILLGTNSGLYLFTSRTDANPKAIVPPGPFLNFFSGMRVIDGVFISATSPLPGRRASNVSNTGYMVRKGLDWDNRNTATSDVLKQFNTNSLFVSAGSSKHYFFGSWGAGFVMHDVASGQTSVYNFASGANYNPSFSSGFTVIPGMDVDDKGNLWFPVFLASNNVLYQFDPVAKTFKGFQRPPILSTNDHFFGLMNDSFNQKWIPIVDGREIGLGLLVMDLGNLDNTSDDASVVLTQGINNLPNNTVRAILQDRRGEVWVGTAEGLARFIFPNRVIKGNAADRQAERLRIRNQITGDITFFLNRTSITALAVNAANEKWIGTSNDGVYHIREEGSLVSILNHFTTANSPLPSNNIVSLAVDDKTGQVYIATDLGMLSYTDVVMEGLPSMKELKVYPNPYVYEKAKGSIVIEGLSDETRVHILTVDGKLMRQLDVQGGRTTWDALDFAGNRVSTGVYIIVAVDTNGSQKGNGKVVIIN